MCHFRVINGARSQLSDGIFGLKILESVRFETEECRVWHIGRNSCNTVAGRNKFYGDLLINNLITSVGSPKNKIVTLHGVAQFALFATSYLPLFILIAGRQLAQNAEYLHLDVVTLASLGILVSKFGLTVFLTLVSVFGCMGLWVTLRNIRSVAENGVPVIVKDVKNKNSEAIGYVATYLIPFLFQGFDSWYECLSVVFLLGVIYRIYINSSLLLINPVLSFWYAIYEIEYEDRGIRRNGLIISRTQNLQEESEIKLYEIGHKLYFSNNHE